ncbi:hypothetical protein JOM56_011465 [Amanita muscaria]
MCTVDKQGCTSGLLLNALALSEDVEQELREVILRQYVNVALHPLFCGNFPRRGSTCVGNPEIRCRPSELLDKKLDTLLELITMNSKAREAWGLEVQDLVPPADWSKAIAYVSLIYQYQKFLERILNDVMV